MTMRRFKMQTLYETIDRFYLLDIKNPTHPSMFVEEAAYDILIVTLPHKDKELIVNAHAFVFDDRHYYRYDSVQSVFLELPSMEEVYVYLNEKTNETMKLVASIHESIDWMEERLYENKPFTAFMHYWLTYKKDLARIVRLLTLATEVLETFVQRYIQEEGFLATHFNDIHEHLSRTNRSALLAIDKLGNLYTFYTSRNNERMNKTIYFLTILSAIFLPLNLVVGYFGMNTQNLPFSTIASGSEKVTVLLGLCAGVMIGLIFYLRRKL